MGNQATSLPKSHQKTCKTNHKRHTNTNLPETDTFFITYYFDSDDYFQKKPGLKVEASQFKDLEHNQIALLYEELCSLIEQDGEQQFDHKNIKYYNFSHNGWIKLKPEDYVIIQLDESKNKRKEFILLLSRQSAPAEISTEKDKNIAIMYSEPIDSNIVINHQYLHAMKSFCNEQNFQQNSSKNQVFIENLTLENLEDILTNNQLKILHLFVNCSYDYNSDTYTIDFEDNKNGLTNQLDSDDLFDLFNQPFIKLPKLLIINSCLSQQAADIFMKAGIKYVIAIQDMVGYPDPVIDQFLQNFYYQLLEGQSISYSYNFSIDKIQDEKYGSYAYTCCCSHTHNEGCQWKQTHQCDHEMHIPTCQCPERYQMIHNWFPHNKCKWAEKYIEEMDLYSEYHENYFNNYVMTNFDTKNTQNYQFEEQQDDDSNTSYMPEEAKKFYDSFLKQGKIFVCCCCLDLSQHTVSSHRYTHDKTQKIQFLAQKETQNKGYLKLFPLASQNQISKKRRKSRNSQIFNQNVQEIKFNQIIGYAQQKYNLYNFLLGKEEQNDVLYLQDTKNVQNQIPNILQISSATKGFGKRTLLQYIMRYICLRYSDYYECITYKVSPNLKIKKMQCDEFLNEQELPENVEMQIKEKDLNISLIQKDFEENKTRFIYFQDTDTFLENSYKNDSKVIQLREQLHSLAQDANNFIIITISEENIKILDIEYGIEENQVQKLTFEELSNSEAKKLFLLSLENEQLQQSIRGMYGKLVDNLIEVIPKIPKKIIEYSKRIKSINSLKQITNQQVNKSLSVYTFGEKLLRLKNTNKQAFKLLLFIYFFKNGLSFLDLEIMKDLEKKYNTTRDHVLFNKNIFKDWKKQILTIMDSQQNHESQIRSQRSLSYVPLTLDTTQDIETNINNQSIQQTKLDDINLSQNGFNNYIKLNAIFHNNLELQTYTANYQDEIERNMFQYQEVFDEIKTIGFFYLTEICLYLVNKKPNLKLEGFLEYSMFSSSGIWKQYSFEPPESQSQNHILISKLYSNIPAEIIFNQIHSETLILLLIEINNLKQVAHQYSLAQNQTLINNLFLLFESSTTLFSILYPEEVERVTNGILNFLRENQVLQMLDVDLQRDLVEIKILFLQVGFYYNQYFRNLNVPQSKKIFNDEYPKILKDKIKFLQERNKHDFEDQIKNEEDYSQDVQQMNIDLQYKKLDQTIDIELQYLKSCIIDQIHNQNYEQNDIYIFGDLVNNKTLKPEQWFQNCNQKIQELDPNHILHNVSHKVNIQLTQHFLKAIQKLNQEQYQHLLPEYKNKALHLFSEIHKSTDFYYKLVRIKGLDSLKLLYVQSTMSYIKLAEWLLLNIPDSCQLSQFISIKQKFFDDIYPICRQEKIYQSEYTLTKNSISNTIEQRAPNKFYFLSCQPLVAMQGYDACRELKSLESNMTKYTSQFTEAIEQMFKNSQKQLFMKFDRFTKNNLKQILKEGCTLLNINFTHDDFLHMMFEEQDSFMVDGNQKTQDLIEYYKQNPKELKEIEVIIVGQNKDAYARMFKEIYSNSNLKPPFILAFDYKEKQQKLDTGKSIQLKFQDVSLQFLISKLIQIFIIKFTDLLLSGNQTVIEAFQQAKGDIEKTVEEIKSKKIHDLEHNIGSGPKLINLETGIYRQFEETTEQFEVRNQTVLEKLTEKCQIHLQSFSQIQNGNFVNLSKQSGPTNISNAYMSLTYYGKNKELYHLHKKFVQSLEKYQFINIYGKEGVGKTEFSFQLANKLKFDFTNGVYYFSLLELKISKFKGNLLSLFEDSFGIIERQKLPQYFTEKMLIIIDDIDCYLSGQNIPDFEHTIQTICASKSSLILISKEPINYSRTQQFQKNLDQSQMQLSSPIGKTVQQDMTKTNIKYYVKLMNIIEQNGQKLGEEHLLEITRMDVTDYLLLCNSLLDCYFEVKSSEVKKQFGLLVQNKYDIHQKLSNLKFSLPIFFHALARNNDCNIEDIQKDPDFIHNLLFKEEKMDQSSQHIKSQMNLTNLDLQYIKEQGSVFLFRKYYPNSQYKHQVYYQCKDETESRFYKEIFQQIEDSFLTKTPKQKQQSFQPQLPGQTFQKLSSFGQMVNNNIIHSSNSNSHMDNSFQKSTETIQNIPKILNLQKLSLMNNSEVQDESYNTPYLKSPEKDHFNHFNDDSLGQLVKSKDIQEVLDIQTDFIISSDQKISSKKIIIPDFEKKLSEQFESQNHILPTENDFISGQIIQKEENNQEIQQQQQQQHQQQENQQEELQQQEQVQEVQEEQNSQEEQDLNKVYVDCSDSDCDDDGFDDF